MDYKKVIKTAECRELILKLLRFIPDKSMLKIQYKIKTGRSLNLKNPQRFTEKIQVYKLHYKNPIMRNCVDKYMVREYVKKKGLEKILVKLIGKYNTLEEIEWSKLPQQFVMKTTNGGGGLNVIVCKNKQDIDIDSVKKKLKLKKTLSNTGGREWAYYGLNPSIIIEELLFDEECIDNGLNDYKFFCYNGIVEYIVVDFDRYIGHKRNFYDNKWNNLHINSDCPESNKELKKPLNFDKMLEIAQILSEDFPFVRVDLYNVSGKIYFGELTFYPWSGYVQFQPDTFDFLLGEKLL